MADTYDVVGIGFGPSNLALAVALTEHPAAHRIRTVFLERGAAFSWHQGLLLEDATMQVSFLKDLATLRNPTSPFSFVSYLHRQGRLVDFINQKSLFPSRIEFHDYLRWAAAHFEDRVEYGAEVVDVLPVPAGDGVGAWDVVTVKGERTITYRARNAVLATGITPRMPDDVECSERVWHSADLLGRLSAWPELPRQRFAVIGAGQSAAEVTAHLHQRFPTAEVYAIMSRYGYSVADDSPFANRVFDPAAVDGFFTAPAETQRKFYRYHANTNYSVVDIDLINELYRRHYRERVSGKQRLHLLNMTTVSSVKPTPDGVILTVQGVEGLTDLTLDAAVFATGYRPMDPAGVLRSAMRCCEVDEGGRLAVERDYRVTTRPGVQPGIYLQGGTECSHGLSASLLSNAAVRAGEIVESIAARMTSSIDNEDHRHA